MLRMRVRESKLLMWSENLLVCVVFYNVFDFITHTLGSNSTGPSVVELIIFAALSWTVIVSVIILLALVWCFWWSDCKWLVSLL